MRGPFSSLFALVLTCSAVTALAMLLPARDASAGASTWTGLGADANWSTAGNWFGDAAPVAGDDLVFPDSAMQKTNVNDLAPGTSFNSISFTDPEGGYNISGAPIILTNGITSDITAEESDANVLRLDIALDGSQTFAVTEDRLVLSGHITLGDNTLTISGDGVAELRDGASGAGGITSSLSVLFVTEDTTYTGPTNVTSGNFVLAGHDLDPSSVVTVSGDGLLQFSNGAAAGAVTAQSGTTLAFFGGDVSLTGHVTDLTMQSGASVDLIIAEPSFHSQIIASGSVSLGNADLSLSWFFDTFTGNSFTILDKTSAGAIDGTFNGLPEGAIFDQVGRLYQITYQGGDGNDVVLTDVGPAGETFVWGDHNCSNGPGPIDALLTFLYDAGLEANTGDCRALGDEIDVAGGAQHVWGDVDCDGAVGPVDSLKLLRFDAGLSVSQEPGCPEIGEEVSVST